MKDEHTNGKKWPEMVVTPSFIKRHSFPITVTEEILAFIQSGWVVLLDACSTDLIRGPAYIFKTLELT